MRRLDLATISFNEIWPIVYQIRLLRKYLTDDYELTVYDNSSDGPAKAIRLACSELKTRYRKVPDNPNTSSRLLRSMSRQTHDWGLAFACDDLLRRKTEFIGFLDHDVFPVRETSLIDLAEPGFFGIGQNHPWSGREYLWPGLLVFKRSWLRRVPDFRGIPDVNPRHEGDTGSLLADLFEPGELGKLKLVKHSYVPIRPEDGAGTQSWCVEHLGDWVHCGNVSNWMEVPDPGKRIDLLQGMVHDLWTQ